MEVLFSTLLTGAALAGVVWCMASDCERHGHCWIFMVTPRERMFLFCPNCERESPGWSVR
jgi:hypothetical protein